MRIVAVLNQKGGVGKSIIATNLAALGFLEGANTLLVDLDAQANAFDWYAARAEGSPIAGLVVHRADRPLSVPQLRRLVGEGRDLVVLDGAPYADEMLLSGAAAADVIIVPLCPGGDVWPTVRTVKRVLAQADAVREQLEREPARRLFVLNRVKGAGTRTSDAVRRALADEDLRVDLVLHDHTVLAEAFLAGESVFSYAPQAQAATELRRLYRLVMKQKG
jgi:chromosome partitioning protein